MAWYVSTSIIFSIFVLMSCTTLEETKKLETSQAYQYPFNQVWRAAQIALQKYPIKVNDITKGQLTTDIVELDTLWNSPEQKKNRARTGFSYQLYLRVLKDRSTTTRVVVFKKIQRRQDFFSGSQNIESNGQEESALLYRIRRELEVDKAIDAYQSEQNRREE